MKISLKNFEFRRNLWGFIKNFKHFDLNQKKKSQKSRIVLEKMKSSKIMSFDVRKFKGFVEKYEVDWGILNFTKKI